MTPEDEQRVREIAREEIAAALEAQLQRAREIFGEKYGLLRPLDRENADAIQPAAAEAAAALRKTANTLRKLERRATRKRR